MTKEKWIGIQVSKKLFDKLRAGKIEGVEEELEKVKKPKKIVPYLEVIVTGKPTEKRFENFKKVKFPTFCIYGWGVEHVGVINMGNPKGDLTYELHDITHQHEGINRQSGFESLEKMHEVYNIREIVKAKVIIMRGK